MSERSFWVIENRHRGAYIGHGDDANGNWVPKFRWSIPLTHVQVIRFLVESDAQKALDGIKKNPRCSDSFIRKLG